MSQQSPPLFACSASGVWTWNGNSDFGQLHNYCDGHDRLQVLPIRLHTGDERWGVHHIELGHIEWIRRQQASSVAELLFRKLAQTGDVWCTGGGPRLKLSLRLGPAALLVVQLKDARGSDPYFSVTTLYAHPQGRLDGRHVGRYFGRS